MKLKANEIRKLIVKYTFVRDDSDQEDLIAAMEIEFSERMTATKKALKDLHTNVSQLFADLIEEEIE